MDSTNKRNYKLFCGYARQCYAEFTIDDIVLRTLRIYYDGPLSLDRMWLFGSGVFDKQTQEKAQLTNKIALIISRKNSIVDTEFSVCFTNFGDLLFVKI